MKKILFTGARSGIANAVIDKLKEEDYFIYLTVHTDKQLEIVEKKYLDIPNVTCIKVDVTNKLDIEKIEALDIDILVSNAAIGNGGSVAEIDINKIRENFEVNVFGYFKIIQVTLKKMIRKKTGKIINISSLAGIIPIPFLGSYSASKASIIKLTETLHCELKLLDSDIKVVLVEPGLYKTGFNNVMFENKYEQMNIDSYFKNQLEFLRKKETIFLEKFERKNLNSIVKKIIKAIKKENPKFIYRAPLSQVFIAKMYQLFKE